MLANAGGAAAIAANRQYVLDRRKGCLQGTKRGKCWVLRWGWREGGGGGGRGKEVGTVQTGGNDSCNGAGEGRSSEDGDRGVPSWRGEAGATFGEGLGGVSLHAEVVDQHDGKMLLHISRHQVPCMSFAPAEQDRLGENNHGNSHPRLGKQHTLRLDPGGGVGGGGGGGRGSGTVCEGGAWGNPRHGSGGSVCRRQRVGQEYG